MEELSSIAIMVGIATTLATILGKIIEKWINYLLGSTDKSRTINANQETEISVLRVKLENAVEKLAKIETNDLAHINAKLDQNAIEHRDVFVLLSEIKTLVKK